MNKLLLLLLITGNVYAERTLGIGEYRHGPDTSENVACEIALEKAKENAIISFLGQRIEVIEFENCKSEKCNYNKDTYTDVEGKITRLHDTKYEVLQKIGYRSCVAKIVADVDVVKNDINFAIYDNFYEFKHNKPVRFMGRSNTSGYITLFNRVGREYHKIYSMKFDSKDRGFTIPEKASKKRIVAYLELGQLHSKEMMMFVFTKRNQQFKNKYTENQMKSALFQIPVNDRKVVRRYVQIVP